VQTYISVGTKTTMAASTAIGHQCCTTTSAMALFRAFHDAIARWFDFSLLMLPPWLPLAWCYSRIPERQSISYMVLALYIFGYHTDLQVIVPVLIICIAALYKLTGVCLLFSYTWIVQQTNHLISLDELLGATYLVSRRSF
jgi:hypothetical protein